jgi:hypothetical protein
MKLRMTFCRRLKPLKFLMTTIRLIIAFFITFFKSITEIAWGIAGIILFMGLANYYKIDMTFIEPIFFKMFYFIFENLKWFFLAFMFLFGYRYFREVIDT